MGYVGSIVTQNVVSTTDIVDASITTAKLASGAITSSVMPNGSVVQFVSAQSIANITTSNTSATAVSALTCTITPTESGNKIIWDMHGGHMSFSSSVVRVNVWLYIKVGSGSASNAHPSGGTTQFVQVHMDSTFGHSNSMRFVYTTTSADALEFTPYIASSNGSLTTGINYADHLVTCSAMEVKA